MAEKRTVTDLVEEAPKGLFIDRVSTKELPFGEGDAQVVFVLQTLSTDIITYINSKSFAADGTLDQGTFAWLTVKFGVVDIKNAKTTSGSTSTPGFETIQVFGQPKSCLDHATMNKIPYPALSVINSVVQLITNMSPEEVEKLDFFTPAPEVSNATTTPKKRTRKSTSSKEKSAPIVSEEPSAS